MSTAFCNNTGPVSSPSSGQKMVRPVRCSPKMIGQLMELGPLCMGSSDGWYWMVPRRGASNAPCGTNNVTYAITQRSASSSRICRQTSGRRKDFGCNTGSPNSTARSRNGSGRAPSFSGAVYTATTSSPRSTSASSTALPNACCPLTMMRICGPFPPTERQHYRRTRRSHCCESAILAPTSGGGKRTEPLRSACHGPAPPEKRER